MYAPVALRFATYGNELRALSSQYLQAVRELPAVAQWVAEAACEAEVMEQYEPPEESGG